MKRITWVAALLAIELGCGGTTTDRSGTADGGGAGGSGGTGSGGTGGVDCSMVGCGPPTVCGVACPEVCGCCACAPGAVQSIGGVEHVCKNGCWLPSAGPTCSTAADCPDDAYCASSTGECRIDGSCADDLDCDDPNNSYPSVDCVGYAECVDGACGMRCGGNFACRDLAGVSFGTCARLLGWGVVNGQCASISGCVDRGHAFFTSAAECTAQCGG